MSTPHGVNVFVEPDTASAYIGLAGVAVGALLTIATNSLRDRGAARRAREASVSKAAVDLVTYAIQISVAAGTFREISRAGTLSAVEQANLMRDIRKAIAPMQAATVVLYRVPKYGDAAHNLQEAALQVVRSFADHNDLLELQHRISEFTGIAFPVLSDQPARVKTRTRLDSESVGHATAESPDP